MFDQGRKTSGEPVAFLHGSAAGVFNDVQLLGEEISVQGDFGLAGLCNRRGGEAGGAQVRGRPDGDAGTGLAGGRGLVRRPPGSLA